MRATDCMVETMNRGDIHMRISNSCNDCKYHYLSQVFYKWNEDGSAGVEGFV